MSFEIDFRQNTFKYNLALERNYISLETTAEIYESTSDEEDFQGNTIELLHRTKFPSACSRQSLQASIQLFSTEK